VCVFVCVCVFVVVVVVAVVVVGGEGGVSRCTHTIHAEPMVVATADVEVYARKPNGKA
jgi:hypothetical protein